MSAPSQDIPNGRRAFRSPFEAMSTRRHSPIDMAVARITKRTPKPGIKYLNLV